MRLPRLRSIQYRLALLFFIITAGSIAVVYFYVVPQLESSLVGDKLRQLDTTATLYTDPLETGLVRNENAANYDQLARNVERNAEARVTLLGVERERGNEPTFYVIGDSQNARTAVDSTYEVAQDSLAGNTPRQASGTTDVNGERVAMAAQPIRVDGRTVAVAVFSTPLKEVTESVRVIQAQILIAGGIGLLVALVAGFVAARTIAKRVKRLQVAAENVAAGRFGNPVEVDSQDELGELARTFNEMQRKIARLDTARKEFIATASHELKTPLFSLSGFVELLQDEEIDEDTRQEFLATMGEQVERLTKLATDLLDLSRLDSGAMELNPEDADLTEIAQSVAEEFRPLASQHEAEITLEAPSEGDVEAFCDSERVAQIVRILINNALLHTPDGTAIKLSTKATNGSSEIVVVDEGPGIDPDEAEHIFERFHSADLSRGTGLGLAIARELAGRMDGSLSVESKPGETRFVLILPQG